MTEEKQIIPAPIISNLTTNKNTIYDGDVSNTRKMLLVDFDVDKIRYMHLTNQAGAESIKVREDIVKDLNSIKRQLNGYNSPLSCKSFNVSIDNQYISDLARVGLEIMLNPHSAMTETKNPEYSDYYVGPDPINKNKLKVYALAYRDLSFSKTEYAPQKRIIEIFDVRQTYGKYPPKTIKVFKNVFDLTQLFEDRGFIQRQPEPDFFKKSDINKSNWFIFYKPSKINIGYTYKELLSTVYDNNGESIWYATEKKWDGNKFNE